MRAFPGISIVVKPSAKAHSLKHKATVMSSKGTNKVLSKSQDEILKYLKKAYEFDHDITWNQIAEFFNEKMKLEPKIDGHDLVFSIKETKKSE